MVQAAAVLFWCGFASLLLVWILYPGALWLVARMRADRPSQRGMQAATVTVLIAAHNEAANIEARLGNIAKTGSRDFSVSVMVALDRCTDATAELVNRWSNEHPGTSVSWFSTDRRGKAMAHNEAMQRIRTDLVVFTDADTVFGDGFVDAIGHAFDDPRVGYASGVLSWRGKASAQGASNFPLYWRFETWLRLLESRLGICTVGTGACAAMRPKLYVPLHPTSDSDCSTPLDVVQQGYLCRIIADAKAVDYVADTVSGEFRARVRMTSKNFANTIASWKWREGAIRHPWETAGLVLHKLGRWLTPYLALCMMTGGSILLLAGERGVSGLVTMTGYGGIVAAVIGFMIPSLPVFGAMGSFAMANAAFALGVAKAITGRAQSSFGKN